MSVLCMTAKLIDPDDQNATWKLSQVLIDQNFCPLSFLLSTLMTCLFEWNVLSVKINMIFANIGTAMCHYQVRNISISARGVFHAS